MELRDRFDLPITSASAEAVGDYVAAVDLLLSANPGAEQRLARASANDPDFALAHIANARLLQLRGRMPEARAAAARAEALRDRVSLREKGHLDAIAAAVRGSATEALDLVRSHAAVYPRDAMPLSLALGVGCHCPSHSACSVFSGLADGSIITRPNWLCSRNWRHLGARIGGFSAISGGPI